MASGTASGPELAEFEVTGTNTSPFEVTCDAWPLCFRMPGAAASTSWTARGSQLFPAAVGLQAAVSGSDGAPLVMDTADVSCE
jgi:hypothetical protein